LDQHKSLRDELNGVPDDKGRSDAIKAGPPPVTGMGDGIKAGPPPDMVPHHPADDRPPSWFAQNGPALLVCAVVLGYLIYNFPVEGLVSIAKAALGLSLVIFIHELGHFLVAKWCDVHVTTFSIGFGPPIPGCSFKWGETTYKLALFPLGGYVQMVGQIDGDESSDGSEDDPRSYRNKNVWQRMAIISAGVVMNVILAIACFVGVFLVVGKDRMEPSIVVVDTGAPAFPKGIRTGDVIVGIGDDKHPYFENVKRAVMATAPNEDISLEMLRGDKIFNVTVVPRKGKKDLAPMIGFAPAPRLQLMYKRYLDPSFTMPVWPLSAAAKASPSFQYADRIIGSSYDPKDWTKVEKLPRDPRLPQPGQPNYPGNEQCDYFEFAHRMQDMAGKKVIVRVERVVDEEKKIVDIEVPPAFNLSPGVVMRMGPITAVRKGSAADEAEIKSFNKEENIGDTIVGVSSKTVAWGETPETGGWWGRRQKETKSLDPMRLPFELRQEMAKLPKEDRKVTLHLDRMNDRGRATKKVSVDLDWQEAWTYDRAEPLTAASPWPITELGLAYLVKATVADVAGPGPTSNPLEKGDEISKVQVTYLTSAGEKKEDSTDMGSDEWAWFYFNVFLSGAQVKNVSFKVKRIVEGKTAELDVDLAPAEDDKWPRNERGWLLMPDYRRQKADNVFDAVALGFKDTHNSIIQVFQTLHGMIRGRLSVKNMGGPLTIANTAYRIAGVDFSEFVFFLGLISVNLAVINFLPIPVLDGGHMVFLIYEKIRGQGASENIRAGATYVGLLMIGCLMIFVLYLDVTRLFW
jgi:regulator of sigma E protease